MAAAAAGDQKLSDLADQLRRNNIHFTYKTYARGFQKAADRHRKMSMLYNILDYGSLAAMVGGVGLMFAAISKNPESPKTLAGAGLIYGTGLFRYITDPFKNAMEHKEAFKKCNQYSLHSNQAVLQKTAYSIASSTAELSHEQREMMDQAVKSGILDSTDLQSDSDTGP